jgi:membrane-associated phospholipid phosphatase
MEAKRINIHIIVSLFLLITAWVLWYVDVTHQLIVRVDTCFFRLLNDSLEGKSLWSYIWMLMNHPSERWANVVAMLSVHILIIIFTPKGHRKALTKILMLYWVLIQIGILLQHFIYHQLLEIKRNSPSMVLEGAIKLSELYKNPTIKDASPSSFPGGHAFAVLFWAIYTLYHTSKRYWTLIISVASIIALGRLFSGAHWLTDVVYSGLSAYLMFSVSMPLINFLTKKNSL